MPKCRVTKPKKRVRFELSESPSPPNSEDEMEWMVMNMDRFFAPSIQLGYFASEDKYIVSPNCAAKIEDILRRLIQDKARWHFRRGLFMNQIIRNNFIPTLTSVKEDKSLLEATVKVLQEMLTPVECLMPVHVMAKNVEGYRIISELEKSVAATKLLFLDGKSTKAIVDLINSLLLDSKSLSLEECELINHCLLLVRNLLHVSSVPSVLKAANPGSVFLLSSSSQSRKGDGEETEEDKVITEDKIMWNLFAHRFDNVIIQLLTCDQQHLWNITMVQLISLMYREQQQTTIRKLIHEWLELSLAESSEDDENNPMTSSSSDAISTSDPVSDSSERLSPVQMSDGNKNHNSLSSINNKAIIRQRKYDKEDSCKDSGFGRSGSNMDSSQDDSFSERVYKDDLHKTHTHYIQLIGSNAPHKESTDHNKCDAKSKSESDSHSSFKLMSDSSGKPENYSDGKLENDSCKIATSLKELVCDKKSLGDCDDSMNEERDCHRSGSGSEGGSEGSSPIPVLEQVSPISLMDNDQGDPCLPPFSDEFHQELLPEPMLEDSKEQVSIALEDTKEQLSLPLDDTEEQMPLPLEEKMEELLPSAEEDSAVKNTCNSQDQQRHPPKEEESGSSGDSSTKPPPQLPKLLKPMTGQKRSRHAMSQKMLSETQENNESSNSTGSECDEGPHAKRPHHQKPHKMLSKPRPAKMLQKAMQEKNTRRNKLARRKDSNGIKAKALLHHRPKPEDIADILKEFTIDFMLNGYANLVQGLRLQVMLPYQIELDKSHLLWLITYFLRFAVELDLELDQICPVMSVDVVSYLVYEGVMMQEELEIALKAGEDNLVPHVRRLHLVVTALREFFISYDIYLKKDPNAIDIKHVLRIKEELGQLLEVRQLFVLLIRLYRPGVLNLNYLQDLITTNHRFLTTQEATSVHHPSMPSFNIVNHVKQFATMDMMKQYGLLLENFHANDETVNDCIFTMMHHVAGDLRSVNVLLQPSILRTFLRIWKEGFELCVDWADLIEYILRKCTRVRTENPDVPENTMFPKPLAEPMDIIELTNDDLDQLYTLYKSSSSEEDLMDKIRDLCCDDSIEEPIKKEVIQKLLARGFITSSECSKLCEEILPMEPATAKSDGTTSLKIDVMQVSSDSEDSMDIPLSMQLSQNPLKRKKGFYKSSLSEEFKLLTPPDPAKDIHADVKEQLEIGLGTISEKTEGSVEGNMTCTEDSNDWDENGTLSYLIDKLKEEGYSSHIQYLQLQLLEACYSKLKIVGPDVPKPEPVAFHFSLSNQSIPLIPWTIDQEEVFNLEKFRQLLGTLGFHLPSDTGKVYPRIPHFWCPEVLFMVAKKLGPINSSNLRVSVEQVKDMLQKMRDLSLTGSLRTHGIQASEESDINPDQTYLDCDDSSERVSDCSMENNRSNTLSPLSYTDEKLILPEEDNSQHNLFSETKELQPSLFSERTPVTGSADLTVSSELLQTNAMADQTKSTTHQILPQSPEHSSLNEISNFITSTNTNSFVCPPVESVPTLSKDPKVMPLLDQGNSLAS